MEKAILKTLIYADIFDYPLTVFEIHKWLIDRKVSLREVERALEKLVRNSKCKVQSNYYVLFQKTGLITKRIRREKQSLSYFKKAKVLAQILRIIPWIKLVGISGGLAMGNAGKKDDIDLFIVTDKNRLWISRLLTLGLLFLTGQIRRKTDNKKKIAGKVCVNILLEEDKLEQINKDLFTAHEVLQMKPLWHRDEIYSKYLADNEWAFKFLPNWVATSVLELRIMNYESRIKQKNHNSYFMLHNSLLNLLETLAKKFQLWYMKKPKGMERIADGALYFHPKDCRLEVLNKFEKRTSRLNFGTP